MPEQRHRGVATSLVAAAEIGARTLGYSAVYMGISRARTHYGHWGWKFLEMGRAGDDDVLC